MKTLNIKVIKNKETVREFETEWNVWYKNHRKCNAPFVIELDGDTNIEIFIGG